MNTNSLVVTNSRTLATIFKENLENTVSCCSELIQLFSNLDDPVSYITKIKQFEEIGDKLTSEAYYTLDTQEYSELVHITEDLVKRLDDITDGLNNTARLIDICQPEQLELAAHDMLLDIQEMIKGLQREIQFYPDNNLSSLRACCNSLKKYEENVDIIYHEWRKKQRRVLVLSLIEENNWTEILGVLEQTSDTVYHAALILERKHRYSTNTLKTT